MGEGNKTTVSSTAEILSGATFRDTEKHFFVSALASASTG